MLAKQELTEVQDKELLLRVAFGRVDAKPIGSTYGIFTYIYQKNQPCM